MKYILRYNPCLTRLTKVIPWAVLVAQIERLYRSSTVHKTFLALWRDFAVLPAATHLAGMVTLSCVSRSNQRLSPARQHIHLSLFPRTIV